MKYGWREPFFDNDFRSWSFEALHVDTDYWIVGFNFISAP